MCCHGADGGIDVMKTIRIDFGPVAERPRRRVSWLLLGVALLACAGVIRQSWPQWQHLEALHSKQRRALALRDAAQQRSAPAQNDAPSEQQAAMAGMVDRLGMPWAALLSGIESASDSQAVLLSLESNAVTREVRVQAQAQDLPALLAYVRRLAGVQTLGAVQLDSHQIDGQHPQRPVDGTVVAHWRAGANAALPEAAP